MRTNGWCLGIARYAAILGAALASAASLPTLAFTLTITPVPAGGYATSSPGGISCGTGGATCTSSNIAAFTTVTLTAHPDAGCTFVQWSVAGVGTSTTNPSSFPMPNQNASGSATFQCAPVITSAASATFQTGVAGSFTVTVTAVPPAAVSVTSGSLPGGVSLPSSGSLSGTPNANTGGQYPITITATNGVNPPATQAFTLTVNQPPALDFGGSTFSFHVGEAHSVTSPASGYPVPTVTFATGVLPTGITLSTNGTFAGTPAPGTAGTYPVTIMAGNGIAPNATASHTINVIQAPGLIPAPSKNIEGLGQGFTGPAGPFTVNAAPSGANIAVGPSHVVQVANIGMAVFDKAGTAIGGPYPMRNFWTGHASPCATVNDGLPLVQYDRAADRWVLVHTVLQSPTSFYLCVAVSQTPDPAGPYHLYAIPTGQGIDHPTLAVWSDGYYLAYDAYDTNYTSYLGATVCALDRTRMLQGIPEARQCFTTGPAYRGVLPSDLDGAAPPPAGSPNYVMAPGNDPNTLLLWKLHVDWTTPANSTFTGPAAIATDPFTLPCPATPTQCIPQLGTANKLDSLSARLSYRLAYRNFGDHEALVAAHVVTAGSATGMRWVEIRSPGTTPTVFQQGTHAPDANFRWAGSAAMDWMGNLAMGYSVSSATLRPQIRYAARLAGDAAGTLAQGEATLVAGAGAQTGTLRRWGDLTSLRLDPTDDCTFWYTNQYIPVDGSFNWRTRIGAFKLDACIPFTQTTLSSSANPSVYGQVFTITANVSGQSPTGTVAFRLGANTISTETLVAGSAHVHVQSNTVGSLSFSATYSGDAGHAGSLSPTFSQVVNKADAGLLITSHTPNPSAGDAPITVGVSLEVAAPGSGPVTGQVTVSDGSTGCTITLPALSCTFRPLSVGVKTLTASYPGDTHVNATNSAGVSHTVASIAQSIAFGTAPTVTVGGGGTVHASATSGLPVLYSTPSSTCSVGAVSGLVAGLAEGSCTIRADQAGNTFYSAAPQASQTFTIFPTGSATPANLGVSQAGTPSPAWTGRDVVYDILIANAGPGPATGVVLTDLLPAGASFVWASSGCTHVAGTVTCPVGSLANGASAARRVVARPTLPGTIANTLTVTANEADGGFGDNASTSVITTNLSPVAAQALRYRLFSPVTKEHHFTTDLNEYNVLGTYVGTWVQEGTVGKVFDNPGSFNGVAATPYYRLYNTSNAQHHWTTDANEYYTLIQFPQYNAEGMGCWIFPTQAVGTIPLYRLMYPYSVPVAGLHHWTIDPVEYNALIASYGWIGEGGSGYVIP